MKNGNSYRTKRAEQMNPLGMETEEGYLASAIYAKMFRENLL